MNIREEIRKMRRGIQTEKIKVTFDDGWSWTGWLYELY